MPFVPGQSGNQAGRPKSSKNKLVQEIKDLLLDVIDAELKANLASDLERMGNVYKKHDVLQKWAALAGMKSITVDVEGSMDVTRKIEFLEATEADAEKDEEDKNEEDKD